VSARLQRQTYKGTPMTPPISNSGTQPQSRISMIPDRFYGVSARKAGEEDISPEGTNRVFALYRIWHVLLVPNGEACPSEEIL
jgi:hypothetical protein